MARKTVRRSNGKTELTPFNAGEPIMPWDDTSAWHDAPDDCALDDGSYHAPVKNEDVYEAPEEKSEESGTTEHVQRTVKATATKRARNVSQSSRSKHRSEKRSSSPAPIQQEEQTDTLRNARSEIVDAAKSGKNSKDGKLKRRIILIVVAIALCFGLVGSVISCTVDIVESVMDEIFPSDDYSSYDSDYDYSSQSSHDYDADETAVKETVQTKLDEALADTDGTKSRCIAVLDKQLKSGLGFTSEELGIDTDAFAAWAVPQISMEITSAYAFDEDGSAYLESTHPDLYSLVSNYSNATSKYFYKHELTGAYDDDATGTALNDAQKAHMAAAFSDVLSTFDETSISTERLELDREDEGWSIEQDDFDAAMRVLLGDYS